MTRVPSQRTVRTRPSQRAYAAALERVIGAARLTAATMNATSDPRPADQDELVTAMRDALAAHDEWTREWARI